MGDTGLEPVTSSVSCNDRRVASPHETVGFTGDFIGVRAPIPFAGFAGLCLSFVSRRGVIVSKCLSRADVGARRERWGGAEMERETDMFTCSKIGPTGAS